MNLVPAFLEPVRAVRRVFSSVRRLRVRIQVPNAGGGAGGEAMNRENTFDWAAAFKNGLHIALILLLFGFTAHAVLADAGLTGSLRDLPGLWKNLWTVVGVSELFTFIGAVAFVLFGLVGIYEFSYANGVLPLVPPFYVRFKEKRDEKMASKMMELYYKNNIEFIREYEEERIGFVLQSLGLDEGQFHNISYEIVKARVMPEKTEEELAGKLKAMICQKKYIIDQSRIPICDRVYRAVGYYLNLYTALYDPKLCGEIGRIMASYILLCLEKDKAAIRDIDYLIVPSGGNLLLGLEVGKILRKKVIAVLDQERIRRGEFWDGQQRDRAERRAGKRRADLRKRREAAPSHLCCPGPVLPGGVCPRESSGAGPAQGA